MTYEPYSVQTFAGLNLRDDPQEVGSGAAVDLLNVDFDRSGRLRTRAGISTVDTSGGTAGYEMMVPTPSGYMLLVRPSSTAITLDRIGDIFGSITNVGNWNLGASSFPKIGSAALIGTPTSSLVFLSTLADLGTPTLRKYDGTTLATSTGAPSYVAVTPWDNRLVQAGFQSASFSPTGSGGSQSTVWFSDAGAPETYGASNFIHLQPGDGEAIVGAAAWSDLLFVAKESNLFAFYGTSVDATGSPIFQYRRITIPGTTLTATTGPSRNALTVGHDGVYFMTTRGIMRTTGGPPHLVSRQLDPLFKFDTTSFNASVLGVTSDRLYMAYLASGLSEFVYVYDFAENLWTKWAFPTAVKHVVPWTRSDTSAEQTFLVRDDEHLYALDGDATDDNGTVISWHYTSGVYELAEGREVVTRYTSLWGSGSPTLAVLTDRADSDPNAAAVTLGVAPAVVEGSHAVDYQAVQFQHKLSGASAATVEKLTHWIRNVRLPGMRSG